MLPNDSPSAGLEAYQRGIVLEHDRDQLVLGKNGENLLNLFEGINRLSHQCMIGERWYNT